MMARGGGRFGGPGVITDGWGRPKLVRVSALIDASQHAWMSELVAQAQDGGGVRISDADVVAWALARIERDANSGDDLTAALVEWFETTRRSV
jgi:hypothetical protein